MQGKSLLTIYASGNVGIAAFWSLLLMFGLSFAGLCYGIYGIVKTSSSVWMKAAGGSLTAVFVFFIIISVLSFVGLLLNALGLSHVFEGFWQLVGTMAALCAQGMLCISMSFGTTTYSALYLGDVLDYCTRHSADQLVIDWLTEYSTTYSRHRYVAQRTSHLFSSSSALLGVWLPSTVIYAALWYAIQHTSKGRNGDDQNAESPMLGEGRNYD